MNEPKYFFNSEKESTGMARAGLQDIGGKMRMNYLVPKAYVGDPAGSRYVKSDMTTVYKEYAEGLAKFFGL